MTNGKKETLREQITKLREQTASINATNIAQTKSLDNVAHILDKHEKTSDPFRAQSIKNTAEINGIKKDIIPPMQRAIYALYTLGGTAFVLIIGALIKYLLTK